MTYRELTAELQKLTPENLDTDVTVYIADEDEYYRNIDFTFVVASKDDRLDDGHPILVL